MRSAAGCVLLGVLFGVGFCCAQMAEPVDGLTLGKAASQQAVLPKLPLGSADATAPRFEIVAGRAVLVSAGVADRGPSTRPARAGGGRLLPTDARAMTMLLPTDVRHQVTPCNGPTERKP